MAELEDEFVDIIEKARVGLGKSYDDVAKDAMVDGAAIAEIEKGTRAAGDQDITAIASALNLKASALAQSCHKSYQPKEVEVEFEGMDVNFATASFGGYPVHWYGIVDPVAKRGVVIDTGADPESIISWARDNNFKIDALLITHMHQDHVAGAAEVARHLGCSVFLPPGVHIPPDVPGAEFVRINETMTFGTLPIKPVNTPGHTPNHVSYLFPEFVIVGDALFAGSMGRANHAYQDGLESLKHLLELPPSTVLFPGHGPATTVQEEVQHNPFYVSN